MDPGGRSRTVVDAGVSGSVEGIAVGLPGGRAGGVTKVEMAKQVLSGWPGNGLTISIRELP